MMLFQVGVSHTLGIDCRPRLPPDDATKADQKPHAELTIHWSCRNKQRALGVVAPGADTLIHGNPQKFSASLVPLTDIKGHGCGQEDSLDTKNWVSPTAAQKYEVCISITLENMLGISILQSQTLQSFISRCYVLLRGVKPRLRGNANREPVSFHSHTVW